MMLSLEQLRQGKQRLQNINKPIDVLLTHKNAARRGDGSSSYNGTPRARTCVSWRVLPGPGASPGGPGTALAKQALKLIAIYVRNKTFAKLMAIRYAAKDGAIGCHSLRLLVINL